MRLLNVLLPAQEQGIGVPFQFLFLHIVIFPTMLPESRIFQIPRPCHVNSTSQELPLPWRRGTVTLVAVTVKMLSLFYLSNTGNYQTLRREPDAEYSTCSLRVFCGQQTEWERQSRNRGTQALLPQIMASPFILRPSKNYRTAKCCLPLLG